ncbi:hypothetical protein [uncultured Croceitalea sp.]|uniref:hypothetical protein n=1 Tax=uncultured Croceitalea sp. TaxID=1798908 RepID=UPI0033068A58
MKTDQKTEYRSISWQLEIIIAGGLFFTLFTSTDFFKEFYLRKQAVLNYDHYEVLVFFCLYILTRTLLIGFGANLLLRTFWVAYMAIDNWYPKGIAYDKLKLTNLQKERLKQRFHKQERLETLEKWASLSFSFAVLFAMVVISTFVVCLLISMFFIEVLGLEDLVYKPVFNYVMAVVVVLAQLGVLAQFSFTTKITFLDKLLTGIGKAYYYLSGSFLYQRELWTLRSNSKQWVLVGFGMFYLVMATLISVNQLGTFFYGGTFTIAGFDDRKTYTQPSIYTMQNRYYEENLKEGEIFYRGGIQSEVIKEHHLKLFLVHWFWFDHYTERVLDSMDFKKEIPVFKNDSVRSTFFKSQSVKYQATLNQLFIVELNDQKLDSIKWDRYKHPKTGEEGYLTYIGVDSLNKGRNTMHVRRRYGRDTIKTTNWISLPFWKE